MRGAGVRRASAALVLLALGAAAACTADTAGPAAPSPAPSPAPETTLPAQAEGRVTLAFAGDVHFELFLRKLLRRPEGALDPIAGVLGDADVTMANLESAIASGGPEQGRDFHFRTTPAALDVLAAAGVDVVGMANNHAVDYGRPGLEETLAAIAASPVPVVGLGRDADEAYAPLVVTVGDTDVALLAASTKRDHTSRDWAAGVDTPGLAVATRSTPRRLLRAVRAAAEVADVVAVYLHWGTEYDRCPGDKQRDQAAALAAAGADVVVGSHAHLLQGAGWLDQAYVAYGLGNFVWYHNRSATTGVLRVTVEDGRVVGGELVPARIGRDGLPHPLSGVRATRAVTRWEALRGCAGLAAARP